ncbi:MAG TPA: NAD(P)-dependent oxidoreductase [Blastocatellia bacterium]|nr:NAD(P)-dependent oxidoreductase [Blastocatellia bacterium]
MKEIKVGVLGANGQIASTLLRRLAEDSDVKPVAVCRNRVGAAVISDVDCDIRIGPVADEDTARKLLNDCHVVVNCIWPNLPSKEIQPENQAIIHNLAELKSLTRVIHLSSVAVYGCIHSGSTFARPRPDTSYGREKLSLEKYVKRVFSGSSLEYFIIRLGHVFGPHQWLSNSVIDLAGSGRFSLPFDGDCPSNAIHVDELASALTWLVSKNIPSGIYNLAANPQQTWRQIFDWHTEICGLPRVTAMSNEDSKALRESYIRNSQRSMVIKSVVETLGWLRSLPVQQLIGSGEVRNAGSKLLRLMPESITNRVKSANALRQVHLDIGALQRPIIAPDPWFYSDAMPGQYLQAPHSTSYAERSLEREAQILESYRAKSGPQWSFADSPEAWTDSDHTEAWLRA